MNKKVNTLLFVAGATVFNILITVLSFFALFIISTKLLNYFLPDSVNNSDIAIWQFILSFIGGIILSFIIYRFAIKQILKKVDVEKYFDPIFSGKRGGGERGGGG